MTDVVPEQASTLIQCFAEAASFVLSQIAGSALEAQPAILEEPTEAATLIRVEVSGSLTGVFEIAISANMSAQFAALLTGETLEPDARINSDTREAAAELIQQICGNAADRLRLAFGLLELKPAQVDEREPVKGVRHLFLIPREKDILEFEFHIVRLSAAEQVQSEPTQAQGAPAHPVGAPTAARNLDLLLDIELGASLRFGARQMLLKDVIELCAGSVVELDRRVQEPVELLVDGRIIALGEVVIVEGNYGLRILQVATPGDKIACLS
jgi:flagellar motor switch protein FliN/FliY